MRTVYDRLDKPAERQLSFDFPPTHEDSRIAAEEADDGYERSRVSTN
jgi:hypothetical protein